MRAWCACVCVCVCVCVCACIYGLCMCIVYNWGEPERSPTLLSSMHSAVYYISIRTTTRLLCMRQMFHVKHGVDAPPTTCMRSPKRKRLRNQCFATATDINGCSVARSIEVTMVGTARSIEITKVSYHGGSSQSTDVFLCY